MRIIRENQSQSKPKVSFVLMDWGCRESFHTVEYLNNQIIPRDQYEITWIEYYDREPAKLKEIVETFESRGLPAPLDTWIVMARPKGEVFRKHLINNIGILRAKGEILVFMDSDAIAGPTVLDTIIKEFESRRDFHLYLEEIRTADAETFYPFNYPSTKEILASAVNMTNGVPRAMRNFRAGLVDDPSVIYDRNYGACFCARREDLIRFGGFDEHEDYTGYIAGPYETSMRMSLGGQQEIWSFFELLFHTPHPGNDGIGNYSGPHDGRGVSTTAMKILETGRTMPLVENEDIRKLRLELPPAEEKPPVERVMPTEREPKPSSPQAASFNYIPKFPSASWDYVAFETLASFVSEMECRRHGHAYPRIYAVAAYAATLAKALKMPQERVEAVYLAGLFFSAGRQLGQPGGDGNSEEDQKADLAGADFFGQWDGEPYATIREVCLHHNENFDGSGPEDTQGVAPPIEARIIHLADRFDQMINLRQPGRAEPFSKVYEYIIGQSGRMFDPAVVDAFIDAREEFVCIHLKARHDALPFMYPSFRYSGSATGHSADRIGVNRKAGGFGFNVFDWAIDGQNHYFALPDCYDDFDLKDLERGGYDLFCTAREFGELQRKITPELLLQNVFGHNIIACAGEYFALNLVETEFNVSHILQGKYSTRCFRAKSIYELKRALLKAYVRDRFYQLGKRIAKKILPSG